MRILGSNVSLRIVDAGLTQNQKAFNKAMSRVRISVEFVFGDIFNLKLKIGLISIGKIYKAYGLIRNMYTCMYRS